MGCSNCSEYVLPGTGYDYVQEGSTVTVYHSGEEYTGVGKTVLFADVSSPDGKTDISGFYEITSMDGGISFDVIPPTSFNGNVHAGSTTIDGILSTKGFLRGMSLGGTGIDGDAVISAIPNSATIEMSIPATTSSYEEITATPNYRDSGEIFMYGSHWELRTCSTWEDATPEYTSIIYNMQVKGEFDSTETYGTSRAGSGTEYTNTPTYTTHDYTVDESDTTVIVTKGNINCAQTYTFSPYPYPVTQSEFLNQLAPDATSYMTVLNPPLAPGQFIMLKCPGCCIKTMNYLCINFDTSSYVPVHDDYYWFNGSIAPDSGVSTWKKTTTETKLIADTYWGGANGSSIITNEIDSFDHIPLLGSIAYSDASYYCNPDGDISGSLGMGFDDTRFLLTTDGYNKTETDSEDTNYTYTPYADGTTEDPYSYSTSSLDRSINPNYDMQDWVTHVPARGISFYIIGSHLDGTYTYTGSYTVPSSSVVITSASSAPDGGNFNGGGTPPIYRNITDTTLEHRLNKSSLIQTMYQLDIIPAT